MEEKDEVDPKDKLSEIEKASFSASFGSKGSIPSVLLKTAW